MDINLKDSSSNKKTIFIILIALLVLLVSFGSYSLLHKSNKISYKNLVSSIDDISEYLKANSVVAEELSISEDSLLSEEGVIRFLNIRGIDSSIIYRYLKSSQKVDNKEVSSTSSEAHPEYISYYTSTSGDTWAIYIVNNETFAINISETSDTSKQTTLTENGYILIYDEATNSYIKLIPNDNVDNVFKVKEINKDTLDTFDKEVIVNKRDNSNCNPVIIYENPFYTYEYEHDEKGRITGYYLHTGDTYSEYTSVTYDDNGDYTLTTQYEAYMTTRKYSLRGLLLEDGDSYDTLHYTYVMDDNDNVASFASELMQSTYTYNYNDEGYLVSFTGIDDYNWVEEKTLEYDENGYLVSLSYVNGDTTYVRTFTYTFNDDGTIDTVTTNSDDMYASASAFFEMFPYLNLNSDKEYEIFRSGYTIVTAPIFRFDYSACEFE